MKFFEYIINISSYIGEDMLNKRIYLFIYLSIIVPIHLSAAPLDKYYVPKQSEHTTAPITTVSQSVYSDFKNAIRNYSPQKKEKMRQYYSKKMQDAVRDRNFDAATHYERLIVILNASKE